MTDEEKYRFALNATKFLSVSWAENGMLHFKLSIRWNVYSWAVPISWPSWDAFETYLHHTEQTAARMIVRECFK
jgi:hypothetical protein